MTACRKYLLGCLLLTSIFLFQLTLNTLWATAGREDEKLKTFSFSFASVHLFFKCYLLSIKFEMCHKIAAFPEYDSTSTFKTHFAVVLEFFPCQYFRFSEPFRTFKLRKDAQQNPDQGPFYGTPSHVMILEADRRKETIMINIDTKAICRYHLDEMFSARQEQFMDRVGDIDGEEDEEGGEGAGAREGG